MLVEDVAYAPPTGQRKFYWARINSYRNTDFTIERLISLHNPSKKQFSNIKKQALQIRYVLQQAQEYFESCTESAITTRPTQFYYFVMGLALFEILLKQSGESSLDKARAMHGHHGLRMKFTEHKKPSIKELLTLISVNPMIGSTGRIGTFELWHRSARHLPIVGRRSIIRTNGLKQDSVGVILVFDDTRLPMLSDDVTSLGDILVYIPALTRNFSLSRFGVKLARGKITEAIDNVKHSHTRTIVLQPGNVSNIQRIADAIQFSPAACSDTISLTGDIGHSGFILNHIMNVGVMRDKNFSAPNGFSIDEDEIGWFSDNICFNEFGLYYICSYMLGMFARYYPDYWMKEYESSTEFAALVAEFIDAGEDRVLQLMAAEGDRKVYINRAT